MLFNLMRNGSGHFGQSVSLGLHGESVLVQVRATSHLQMFCKLVSTDFALFRLFHLMGIA